MTDAPPISPVGWRKSTYSGSHDDNCPEVAQVPRSGRIAIRDSKSPSLVLLFGAADFSTFVTKVKAGHVLITEM